MNLYPLTYLDQHLKLAHLRVFWAFSIFEVELISSASDESFAYEIAAVLIHLLNLANQLYGRGLSDKRGADCCHTQAVSCSYGSSTYVYSVGIYGVALSTSCQKLRSERKASGKF